MNQLTDAETALLGLLAEGPMYPYQIEQQVKYRDMRFWTDLSMSSIYKLLRKLEKEELVSRTNQISPNNRLQKIYSISRKGQAALKDKIEEILRLPEHVRWRIDIGIYNSGILSKEEIRTALNEYRSALRKKIVENNDLLAFLRESGCPPRHQAIAKRPVFLLDAEIKWVESYLSELETT